jgi:hypothetical protein
MVISRDGAGSPCSIPTQVRNLEIQASYCKTIFARACPLGFEKKRLKVLNFIISWIEEYRLSTSGLYGFNIVMVQPDGKRLFNGDHF